MPNDHIFWLLILSVLCIGVSIVLSYISRWESIIAAFAALMLGHLSHFVALNSNALWFWGAASIIAIGISILLPQQVRDSKIGLPYFVTGAIVGAFIGMLLNSVAGVITSCALGIALAALAFSRTPAGAKLEFPAKKSLNYLCAKGLPLVVIYSMLGILALQLILVETSL